MGGFHLINAKPEIIQSTVSDIKAMKPDVIVPAHCTGFEAIVAFSREMPGAFVLNTAGNAVYLYRLIFAGCGDLKEPFIRCKEEHHHELVY